MEILQTFVLNNSLTAVAGLAIAAAIPPACLAAWGANKGRLALRKRAKWFRDLDNAYSAPYQG